MRGVCVARAALFAQLATVLGDWQTLGRLGRRIIAAVMPSFTPSRALWASYALRNAFATQRAWLAAVERTGGRQRRAGDET